MWMSVASCRKEAITYDFEDQEGWVQYCRYPRISEPEEYQFYTGYTVQEGKRNPSLNVFQWRGAHRVITFVGHGRPDGGDWWFGKMNGQSTAGYHLSRHHYVFSTVTGYEFECWNR
jgi:hypothetical protein